MFAPVIFYVKLLTSVDKAPDPLTRALALDPTGPSLRFPTYAHYSLMLHAAADCDLDIQKWINNPGLYGAPCFTVMPLAQYWLAQWCNYHLHRLRNAGGP